MIVRPATPADAEEVLELTRAVFAAYADLEPQPSSLCETAGDVARDLASPGGLTVRDERGRLVAAARFSEDDDGLWLRRVAVSPDDRRHGIAALLADAAEDVARERGYTRPLGLRLDVPTAQEMHDLGLRLATMLRAGDLVVLTGDLGAGKTTLTRGLGEGLGVRGQVTSPTFVIARVHPAVGTGPPLVHVDAYRIGDLAEIDDLDLDASLDESVTVVEWGEGKVEGLAEARLDVRLLRGHDDGDESREVRVRGVGQRWAVPPGLAVLLGDGRG